MTIKINIGCGKTNFGSSWYHIDQIKYDHVDSHDIFNIPFEDNSVDMIYASHVLEYFDQHDGLILLSTWYEKLNKGGCLRLAVPSFEVMAWLYIERDYPLESLLGPLYGRLKKEGNDEDFIYHKTIYDHGTLCVAMKSVGFKNIRGWNWRDVEHGHIDDCSQAYLPHMDKNHGTLISLNIQGMK